MGMNAAAWDERYQEWDYVWSVRPNRFVEELVETAGLLDGRNRRALDWACGEGRNGVWLAEHGWRVTGADFSTAGLTKARRLADDRGVSDHVDLVEADVTTWEPPQAHDLVIVSYLQLPPGERRRALGAAARALRPGGTLLLVAHDLANLEDGTGGPRDPEVLTTPEAVLDDLRAAGVDWAVREASTRARDVEEADRAALDTIVRARRAGRVVEVFADVGCAFTHLGLRRFVQARRERGRDDVVLHVRSWPLQLVNGRPLDPAAVARQVEALRATVAPEEFRGFRAESYPASCMPAMALAAAAYDHGVQVGEAVNLELRDLLFEQGLDIADPAVLAEVSDRHGVDFQPAVAVGQVRADHAEGVERGVIGSPHFFCGSHDHFCPALEISRDPDGGLVVQADQAGFAAFLDVALAEDDQSSEGPDA